MAIRNVELMEGQKIHKDILVTAFQDKLSEYTNPDNRMISMDDFFTELFEYILDDSYEKFLAVAKLIMESAWDGGPHIKLKMELGKITIKDTHKGQHPKVRGRMQSWYENMVADHSMLTQVENYNKDDFEINTNSAEDEITIELKAPIYR